MKKIFLILCSAALMFACDDKDENKGGDGNGTISLSSETIYFNLDGTAQQSNSVTVTSSGQWRLAGKKTWCEPSVVSGKSGNAVTFTAEPNTTDDIREITYTFMCGSKTAQLVVVQTPATIVEFPFNKTEYPVASAGGYVTIAVKSNLALEYEIAEEDRTWITPAATRGAATAEWLQFIAAANDTFEDRAGKIVFFEGTDNEQTITISQPQNNAIIPEKDLYTFGLTAGSVTVPVQANVDYTVVIDSRSTSWLSYEELPATRGLSGKKFKFTYTASAGSRIANVQFKCASDSNASKTIQIKQQSPNPVYAEIPDANFRTALESLGYILVEQSGKCEVSNDGLTATTLSVNSKSIYSLEGIGAFPAIETLNISYNNMTEIDLSKNLSLKSLNVYRTGLAKIVLGNAPLEAIDFQNYHYQYFYDYDTWSYTYIRPESMVVSGTKLKNLSVKMTSSSSNYDQLTTLDVSECPALETLNCHRARNILTSLILKTGQALPEANITKNTNVVISYK